VHAGFLCCADAHRPSPVTSIQLYSSSSEATTRAAGGGGRKEEEGDRSSGVGRQEEELGGRPRGGVEVGNSAAQGLPLLQSGWLCCSCMS
jgi:hypothetical protein